jgi:hypothetical protein
MMRVRRQIFIKIDVVVWNVKVLSHKLQTAIDEVKRGNTVKYDSVEDMMKDLKA